MRSKILHLYSILERDRKLLLKEVSVLSSEQYHRSYQGKWSVGQILTHLVTSEYLSLGYMKKKSLGIDKLDDSGVWENLKLVILKISQRLPIRYKAPQVVVTNTPPIMSYDQVVANWDMLRSDIKEFIDEIDNKNLKKKIYKHPVAGRLNVYQALSFFNEHVHHHWPQIKRLSKT